MPSPAALRPYYRPPPLSPPPRPARTSTGPQPAGDLRAWEQHASTILAVPTKLVSPVNVELILLTSAVLAVAKHAAPYRERLSELPGFELSWLDELPSLARAVRHLGVERRVEPSNLAVAGLIRRASAERRRLAQVVLMKRAFAGTPTRHALPPMKGRSPMAHAVALHGTVLLLRKLGLAQTPVTETELAAAEALVTEISKVSDPRQRVPEGVREGRVAREKALVLLAAVYGEVRAAVLYVGRHEKQIDRVVPALYSLRKNVNARRRRARKAAAEEK